MIGSCALWRARHSDDNITQQSCRRSKTRGLFVLNTSHPSRCHPPTSSPPFTSSSISPRHTRTDTKKHTHAQSNPNKHTHTRTPRHTDAHRETHTERHAERTRTDIVIGGARLSVVLFSLPFPRRALVVHRVHVSGMADDVVTRSERASAARAKWICGACLAKKNFFAREEGPQDPDKCQKCYNMRSSFAETWTCHSRKPAKSVAPTPGTSQPEVLRSSTFRLPAKASSFRTWGFSASAL